MLQESNEPHSDLTLLKRYATERSPDALEVLVRRNTAWLRATAIRRLGATQHADDVVQAVFVILAQRPPKHVRSDAAVAGWLFKVACYASSHVLRTEARLKRREKAFAMLHPESTQSSDAPEMSQSEWDALSPHLDAAVQSLPRTDREAVLLRYYQQKSHLEVARAMGISHDAARKRLQRAIGKLRDILTRRGAKAPDVAVFAAGLLLHATPPAASAAMIGSFVTGAQASLMAASASNSIAKGTLVMLEITKLKIAAAAAIGILLAGAAAIPILKAISTPGIADLIQTQPKALAPASAPASGNTVYVGGEVRRSGAYSLSTSDITLRALIIAAGAPDPDDGDRFIELSRPAGNGQRNVSFYNLHALFVAQSIPDPVLQAGDQINVGPTKPVADGWRGRFDQVYRLSGGVALKRIAPPFIPEREMYERDRRSVAETIRITSPDSYTFSWDGALRPVGFTFSSRGSTIHSVLSIVGLKSYEFELPDDPHIAEFELSGDWITRQDAAMPDLLAAACTIIRDAGGPSLVFRHVEVERPVIVATGEYSFRPPAGTFDDSRVNLYSDQQDPTSIGGGGTADVSRFLRTLATFTATPVIDKVSGTRPEKIVFMTHMSAYLNRLPRGADRDAKIRKLLEVVSQQTGLVFTFEQHRIPIWQATLVRAQ